MSKCIDLGDKCMGINYNYNNNFEKCTLLKYPQGTKNDVINVQNKDTTTNGDECFLKKSFL